jgi:hypothetical protein
VPARSLFVAAVIAWVVVACDGPKNDLAVLSTRVFTLADGRQLPWSDLRGGKATVLITLDPECPFCQGYAPVIDSLARSYAMEDVRFVGLYPAAFINADSARHYAGESGFDFPQVMDRDCAIADLLRARVTPECFLLDSMNTLVYRGALDDWAVRTGRHRATATKHYLAEAIGALLRGQTPTASVPAVGCIVECEGANADQ